MAGRGRRGAAARLACAALACLAVGALAGCAHPVGGEARIGLARSETGVVVAVVVMCTGLADGLQLHREDPRAPVFGDRSEVVTTWLSPEPITGIGATDLVGTTFWPAEPPIDRLDDDTVYSLVAIGEQESVSARPITFSRDQFDTLSSGEVLVGDVAAGTSRYLQIDEFFDMSCR